MPPILLLMLCRSLLVLMLMLLLLLFLRGYPHRRRRPLQQIVQPVAQMIHEVLARGLLGPQLDHDAAFARAVAPCSASSLSMAASRSKLRRSSSIFPASTRARSRMSFNRVSRLQPEVRITLIIDCC